MRTVICHYHIYKNSGTTFDALLTENYGNKHICFDGPFPFFNIDQEQFSRVIARKENVVAFSSHQILLPVPVSLDFLVLPVVFIRHPLLRVHSIYKFKRQEYDGTVTSRAAQKKSFDEWISHCFNDRQEITHISNAQTRMLGGSYRQKSLIRRAKFGMEYDVYQAARNLQNVQLLARTEYFSEDVRRFSKILGEFNIDFKVNDIKPKNTTSNNHNLPISIRLKNIEKDLSDENRKKLWDANKQDLLLFEYAKNLIEESMGSKGYSLEGLIRREI